MTFLLLDILELKFKILTLSCDLSTTAIIYNSFSLFRLSHRAKQMDNLFRGLGEESSPNHQQIVRCPFLQNINEPTNFSLSTAMAFSLPVSQNIIFCKCLLQLNFAVLPLSQVKAEYFLLTLIVPLLLAN